MLSASAAQLVAVCVLAGLVAALAGWLVVLARSVEIGPFPAALYWLTIALARVLWRAEVSGPLPVEPGQGAVIVCNHRAPFDPSFIYLATRRIVHWMVAKEYVTRSMLAWFFRATESISVSRGGIDTAATKMAIRYAQEGELVGIFPEGRINKTERLFLPGRPGAAMIAMRARVPVIPCYVTGSPNDGTFWGFLFMAAKVRIEVGSAIDTGPFCGRENKREAAEELTKTFLREMARLAGEPDFEPKLAGRFYKPGLDRE